MLFGHRPDAWGQNTPHQATIDHFHFCALNNVSCTACASISIITFVWQLQGHKHNVVK